MSYRVATTSLPIAGMARRESWGALLYVGVRGDPVRMALGARQGQVLSMVVASGTKMALLGLVLGLAGAGVLTRVLQTLLYGTSRWIP